MRSRICKRALEQQLGASSSATKSSSNSTPASKQRSIIWAAGCRCSTASSALSSATRPTPTSISCPASWPARARAFVEILRYHMRRATGEEASKEAAAEWIKDHVARLQQTGRREEIQNLSDGRVIRVTYRAAGRRRMGRHAGGHHRPATVGREDRMAGAPRYADRDPQPLPFPRASRASVRDLRSAPGLRAVVARSRSLQGNQRSATAISSATAF